MIAATPFRPSFLMTAFDPRQVLHRLTTRLRMRQLTLLLHIEQQGSITRAAECMASSQPAVTQSLAELEDVFGAPLFECTSKGMVPTPLGQLVLACARGITQDLGRLVGDIELAQAGQIAHIHIGVASFVPGRLLVSAIERTRADAGQRIGITLHEGTSAELVLRLQDHALDLVVGRAQATPLAQPVAMEVLYQQPPRLIAERRLAARLGRVRSDWARLAELDWVLGPPRTAVREQVVAIFLGAGVPPPLPVTESQSARLIGEAVATGQRSVSIVPADVADELVHVAGVSVVPYSFEWSLSPLALFRRHADSPPLADQAFANALRHLCADRAHHVAVGE